MTLRWRPEIARATSFHLISPSSVPTAPPPQHTPPDFVGAYIGLGSARRPVCPLWYESEHLKLPSFSKKSSCRNRRTSWTAHGSAGSGASAMKLRGRGALRATHVRCAPAAHSARADGVATAHHMPGHASTGCPQRAHGTAPPSTPDVVFSAILPRVMWDSADAPARSRTSAHVTSAACLCYSVINDGWVDLLSHTSTVGGGV